MKKMMKTMIAALVGILMLGSFAMAEGDIVMLSDLVVIEENQEQPVRVAFHDFEGKEVWFVEVAPGSTVQPMEQPPVYGEFMFDHWFDAKDADMKPFTFDSPVYENVMLYPFYTSTDATGSDILVPQQTEEAVPVDVLAVIQQGEKSAQPEKSLNDLIGEVLVSSQANNEQAAAPEANVMSDTNVQDLINDIIGGQPEETEMVEDEEDLGDDDEDLVTIEDDDVPLAGPAMTAEAQPYVLVSYDYDGEQLTPGTRVTVRAELYNVPAEWQVAYQWQNDASGAFADVAGATSQEYSFVADANTNTDCNWQVSVMIAN